jgi:hypothetical protein
MERQFESAKFDLARKLLVEKVISLLCGGILLCSCHVQEELKARLDRDREVLAKRLDGERTTREELQGELVRLQRQTQALENVEEMLFKEKAQRQRAERSIVELARSLGTLKAALLHAGVPVPLEARPSSALQSTVQVISPTHAASCAAWPCAWACLLPTATNPSSLPFLVPFAASGAA